LRRTDLVVARNNGDELRLLRPIESDRFVFAWLYDYSLKAGHAVVEASAAQKLDYAVVGLAQVIVSCRIGHLVDAEKKGMWFPVIRIQFRIGFKVEPNGFGLESPVRLR